MPGGVAGPTPYPEINAVVGAVLAGVQTTLGERFVGMYLSGSLASGDFHPESSDIDLLIVTADELPEEMLPDLEAMHTHIRASGLKWATKLEVSYIPRQALRRYDPAQATHPVVRTDGSFDVEHHQTDWVIHRHIIRERGVVVDGPPPRELIDPILPDDLRRAVLGLLRGWWTRQLRDPVLLRTREYQAYAVLTMCRMLFTLQHGITVSKPVAARWAREALGEPWAALIDRALAWRGDPQPDTDRLDETLDFIRYTLARSRQFDIAAHEPSGS